MANDHQVRTLTNCKYPVRCVKPVERSVWIGASFSNELNCILLLDKYLLAGCEHDRVGSGCYSYHTEQVTWHEATGVCTARGGHLLWVETMSEWNQLIGNGDCVV